jgi:serine/threonine-protein kinase
VDRKGKEEPIALEPREYYQNPSVSPDGTKVALRFLDDGNRDIWIWDTRYHSFIKLTLDPASDGKPLWTLDGNKIVFYSSRGDFLDRLYRKNADGSGKAESLVLGVRDGDIFPESWADDGNTLVLSMFDMDAADFDIGIASMEDDKEAAIVLGEEFREAQPRVSPDGKWLAYTSNESGQNQIYVRPFPNVEEGRHLISAEGGDSPLWSPDGKELFYRNGDEVMTVSVDTDPNFSYQTPRLLFRGTYIDTVFRLGSWDFSTWDIHPDGERFLMIKNYQPTDEASDQERRRGKFVVVLNWFEELKQRVPVN